RHEAISARLERPWPPWAAEPRIEGWRHPSDHRPATGRPAPTPRRATSARPPTDSGHSDRLRALRQARLHGQARKMLLTTSVAQPSSSLSTTGGPPIVLERGRVTRMKPAASLITLPGYSRFRRIALDSGSEAGPKRM